MILLFHTESGAQYGYQDQWVNGVFHLSGERQVGDMKFIKGNKALRDHHRNNEAVYLFSSTDKPKYYTFEGQFNVTGYHYETAPDINDNDRQAIIFEMVLVEDDK